MSKETVLYTALLTNLERRQKPILIIIILIRHNLYVGMVDAVGMVLAETVVEVVHHMVQAPVVAQKC